jgi:hypothetical protein
MAKQYANIQPGFDTFAAWVTKTNNLLNDMSNIVVTIAANSTGGITTGNAYINGTLSSPTGAFNTIRGGNVSTNAALTIASNVSIANSYALTFGNATVNTTVNATSFSGMANSANSLTTSRNIALTTDATGNGDFNGTANLTIAVTLANSGVTANTYGNTTTYPVITVDAKGRVTTVTAQTISTPASGVTTFNTRSGAVSLTAADITGNSTIGLNYTPVSSNTSGTINGSLTLTSGDLTLRDVISSRDIRAGNSTVNSTINATALVVASNTATFGNAVYIVANGNVGIGTASPRGLFHVTAAANDSFLIRGHLQLANGISLYSATANNDNVKAMEFAASSFYFNTGYVGIGNTTPTNILSVQGNTYISGGIIANGSIGSNGQVLSSNGTGLYWASSSGATLTANNTDSQTYYFPMSNTTSGAWSNGVISNTQLYFVPSTGTLNSTIFNSLSDAAAKDNVETIADATRIVNQLTGVTFNWKTTGDKSSGVIAQDLEKIIPFLVTDTDGTKSVNYSGLIAYLIQAVKELSAKVDRLENN